MLLVNQVELLRRYIEQFRNQRLALPLMGGVSDTSQTYRFKSLLLPARDIATTIAQADPAGDKLPDRLRGWNVDVEDGWGKAKTVHLKKLLGMIIHVYYLNVGQNRLDISNDLGERVIVPYDSFLALVQRLVLTPEDICLVICSLAEERFKSRQAIRALRFDVPGSGDLLHCLWTIGKWPALKEIIWSRFFADQSSTVDPNCKTINDVPFGMGGRHTESAITWHMGWRRDDVYATSWIDVSCLIHEIRGYFCNSIPRRRP